MNSKWDKLNKELDDALDAEFGSEEPKQETLEEAAENHLQKWRQLNNIHLSNILHAERCKNDFIAGAKWQQEQMEKLKDFDTWKEWKNTGII